ncbi:MAG TPA: glutamine amidotransferase [Gammaproteobacteria bacterium]|nr:glutamine amidotransferase [Gammaproteobacteria bacterium]
MPKGSELPLSIWVTGGTLPEVERERGTFADLIRATVGGAWPGPWLVADVTAPDAAPTDRVAGVVVTGSPARIADQTEWMRRAQARLADLVARRVPVLGICFGHQMLAVALGGRSGPNPAGREIGTVLVRRRRPDELLGGGNAPRSFYASTTHLDTLLELPPGAEALADTERDRYAAVRFGPRAWGLQFHPEMDGDVVARYIGARAEALRAEGLDPDALLADCRDTPESAELLRRFARLCADERARRNAYAPE